MTLELNLSEELRHILAAIRLAGGEPLFVGGFVRDVLMGHEHKDFDIEVYGVGANELHELLKPFGWTDTVGASFGIIKLRTEHQEYDFSLPRRESKTGQGHKGFMVEADPTMTFKEAASRRDFTINAMALTLEGKLLDDFGGLDDWQNRILRHTSDKFAEDPLRVLRGFQFAGRFGLDIYSETAELAKSLKPEYTALSKERIWNEWKKWAEQSVKPSLGLYVLEVTEWLEFYPELVNLINIPQDPQWHPEGDVWTHTKWVVDEAAFIARREGLDDAARLLLVLAALCHDLGKATTTALRHGRWTSPRHASEGEVLAATFLKRIHAPKSLIDQVKPLVKNHMVHLDEQSARSVRRLALRLEPTTVDMLALLIEADASGRPPLPKGLPESAHNMLELAKTLDLDDKSPKAILKGRHLIELAKEGRLPERFLQGGAHFSALLNQVFQAQLDGEVGSLEEAEALAVKMTKDKSSRTQEC